MCQDEAPDNHCLDCQWSQLGISDFESEFWMVCWIQEETLFALTGRVPDSTPDPTRLTVSISGRLEVLIMVDILLIFLH